MPVRLISRLVWSQRRLVIWLTAILCLFALIVFLKRGDISKYVTRYENRNRLRDEVELLQLETQRLEKKRETLEKGGYEAEKAAREQFRMSRPGEHVLYLDPPEGKETRQDAASTSAPVVSTETLRSARVRARRPALP